MSGSVWDASALLMVLNAEPGWESLAEEIGDALVSTVNLAEVIGKLADAGVTESDALAAVGSLPLEIVPFDQDDAATAGLLGPPTRSRGLSLGDRACLATGIRRKLPVVTTDRSWSGLEVGVEIRLPQRNPGSRK